MKPPLTSKGPCLLIVAWLLPLLSRAHTVDEIRSLRERNDSGVVINWTVPGQRDYDGYAILPSASVFFQTGERTALTYEYQVVFSLLDDQGRPMPILDENGRVGMAY